MKKRCCMSLLRATILSSVYLASQAAAERPELFGQLTLASDYLFRGISQTLSAAALQGTLGLEHESGLYGYVWASNVDFTPSHVPDDGASLEVNVGAGYSADVGVGLTATLELTRYLYPGTAAGVDYNYSEWNGMLELNEQHRLILGFSDNVFGSGAPGNYYALGTEFTINPYVGLYLDLGFYDLERAYGTSYGFGRLGVGGVARAMTWRVSYVSVTDGANDVFLASTAADRLMLALQFSF